MKPYIAGIKGRQDILDLSETETQLAVAARAMETLAREGKIVLYVGGKTEIASLVREAAERIDAPYVATRWLGGTISNWPEIKKRIDRLAELSEKKAADTLAKGHTKLEVVRLEREMARLAERLDGITALPRRPDALVVIDTKHEKHAVNEAKGAGIPVIALMGSDCNLADAAYPIVANDASRETVRLILGELTAAFEKGVRA